MEDNKGWCKAVKIFKAVYTVLIIVYIIVILILLGITFDIDFLDNIKHSLIYKHGNITTPVLILTTLILFIPFVIMVTTDSLHTAEEIKNINDVELANIDNQIEIALRTCDSNSKDIYTITSKTLDIKKEQIRLQEKLLQVKQCSEKIKRNDIHINKQLNIIAKNSPLCDIAEVKIALNDYSKSANEVNECLHI